MVSLLVVLEHPGPSHFPDLIQIPEQPSIEYLCAVGPVEAFDIGVLVWLSRLDVTDLDVVLLTPVYERLAGQFGSVVTADRFG